MPASNSKTLECNSYRFDSFEVCTRPGILLREGQRLKIQELPLQMLLVLLERPGEIVTKEELGRRLWGQETFVEVDKSLYVVAAKLRDALEDEAASPRYIKTVSGRGYRFIGEVTPVLDSAAPDSPERSALLPEESKRSFLAGGRAFPSVARIAVAAVLVAAASYLFYRYTQRPLASDHDRIVVGGFSNGTGNPDLDGILSSAARLKLQESPYLNLIPDQNFHSLVKNPDSAPLNDQVHVCASLGGQILLSGQLLALKRGYQVLLTARRCVDGRLMTTQMATADSQPAILSALDLATERMRRRLGEPDSSLQKYNLPSAQAMTASLAALKAFTVGDMKRAQDLNEESIASYKLAVDLDPQFALAYARLGIVYTNTRQPSLSRQYYKKAFDLRNRTTDRDRLYIITHYYAYTTGEINRAIEDYELWKTLYPRDLIPANNLAVEYLQIGQPQKSVESAIRAIQIDPNSKFPYAMLAQGYLRTGAYDKVHKLCTETDPAKMDIIAFHDVCFQAAFARNDEAGMQREMQWAHGNPQESILITNAAWVAMYHGKVAEAQKLFAAARQNALQHNLDESAADISLDKANAEADLGLLREAREDATSGLQELGSGSAAAEQAFAALALARAGDIARAKTEATEAASQAPLDTILNFAVLPSTYAAIQLHKNDPRGAIQFLEKTRPYDNCDNLELSPAYYRGLAYLQSKQFPQAIREFRQVLAHRVLEPNSLYVLLAQLQLGRALQLSGDRAGAAQAYAELEQLWKNADTSFPPLQWVHSYQRELHVQ